MLIIGCRIHDKRETFAVLEPEDNPVMPLTAILYAEGRLPPRYTVPSTLGPVTYYTGFGRKLMVVLDDSDETFDPAYTWDSTNGMWPRSPNNR